MHWINTFLTAAAGIGIRLLIPIAITAVAIILLRRLDTRWQSEASLQPVEINKPECWKIKGCAKEIRKACKGAQSPQPCWQALRQPNGYLKEECLLCNVFRQAPIHIKI